MTNILLISKIVIAINNNCTLRVIKQSVNITCKHFTSCYLLPHSALTALYCLVADMSIKAVCFVHKKVYARSTAVVIASLRGVVSKQQKKMKDK